MQFKHLALLGASVSTACAQGLVLPTDPSVLAVLATGIPASVQELARSSPAALISQLSSSLSAGTTPEWYAALPTDVRSILPSLFPASTSAATTPAATTTIITSAPVASTTGTIPNLRNSTTVSTVRSPTLSSTSTDSEVTETSSSTGGASYPTAVLGAGVAGALGVLGMLAL